MTREYINPPGVPQRVHYTHVLKIDKPSKLIYIAGQTPADDKYQPVHLGDVRAQYIVVLAGLTLQLKAAGATWDDVVFRRMYAVCKAVEALAKVDIALQPNDFVSLIGPSGCGKSTLFNVIAGLLIPDTGEVKLDGVDIIGQPGNVAYMMQRDLLLPWRTVLENVTLAHPLLGNGISRAETKRPKRPWRFKDAGAETKSR